MYSVVMMIAFTGAPEMPAFGGRGCGCNCSCSCRCSCSCSCNCGGGCRCNACHCGGRRGHCRCHCSCNNGCSCYGGGCWGCCGTACSGGCYGGHMHGHVGLGTDNVYVSNVVSSSPATVVVSLPADAKLTFDGVATTSSAQVRRFVTPTLGAGEYNYTIAAEIVRDGQKLTTTQTVTVRAGLTTEVNLTDASFTSAVAMK